MKLLENIRLLYCLNEVGEAKVNDILKSIITNPEYIKVSYEGLLQELEEIEQQNEIEYKEKQKLMQQKEKEMEDEIEQLEEKYKHELKMIGNQTAFYDQREMIDVIKKVTKASDYWKMIQSFNWGYVQGIRAERARRKKVQA